MWFFSAVLALLAFAGMQLCFKYLAAGGVSTPILLLFVFVITTMLFVLHAAIIRSTLTVDPKLMKFIIAAAVLSYLGNLFMVRAIAEAPNPGYAMGVISGQAVVVTIGAILFFRSDFSVLKGVGIVLTVVGATILGLSR